MKKYEGNLTITKNNAAQYAELEEVTGYLEISADAQLPVLTSEDGE